ncbi:MULTISPECIES: metallopeptidase family protein [Brevibacterium]|uniref:Metallopeptidase family protein n=2 Tax=Brevibacterium TaxID=1696 RepID=A0A7T4DHD9_9MICO|nr:MULTISPECIES: metallopeptidase family protein [Brevibacterium]QQB13160.1 metallopeptidase family protein [Brevibacterium casei]
MNVRRRRDRHGRGLRSSLFRADVPARATRAESFARVAAEEFARHREQEPDLLAEVVLAIDVVPPPGSTEPSFGRVFPATPQRRTHIVLYRRPIEYHSLGGTRETLIAEVIADQVALLRGAQG